MYNWRGSEVDVFSSILLKYLFIRIWRKIPPGGARSRNENGARGGGGNLFPGPHGATTFQGRNPENLDTILQPGYPNSR